MSEKNPYADGTPEWQLWELMTSASRAACSFAEDAERMQRKSAELRDKAEAFGTALRKLSA